MRIVVFPNSMEIGGSQINAVELAITLHRRGHSITVFGPPGPLCQRVVDAGLAFEPAPTRPRVRPSPAVMRALTRAAKRHAADLVHGYEWPPILEACYGPFCALGVTPVGTIMSMGVAPFIPAEVPLAVGTAQIADFERLRRPQVYVMEPPVDIELNHPGADLPSVRDQIGAEPRELLVVMVSRLANELKREGILAAVAAVGEIAHLHPVRLVIVGDGPARAEIEQAARNTNHAVGRPAISIVGSVADPRPWYAAADVVLGMGSSALRGMAFAKPLVVQGERGFWQVLTPDTAATFLYQGWYGIGSGADGVETLKTLLEDLLADPVRRMELGSFARVVAEKYDLESAADRQEAMYIDAVENFPQRAAVAPRLLRPALQVIRYEMRRRSLRIRGRAPADDFNAISAQTSRIGTTSTRSKA